MEHTFSRADMSPLGQWRWTVDHVTYTLVLILAFVGLILIQAASPAVAWRYGLDSFHFVLHHLVLAVPALLLMFGVSMMPPLMLLRASCGMFAVTALMLVLTPFIGVETKGAMRWLNVFGFSLQPSEFMKPSFAVLGAWLFARYAENLDRRMLAAAFAILIFVMACLLAQPDIGMTFLIGASWASMYFLAGMPRALILASVPAIIAAGAAGYAFFPHSAARLDLFMKGRGDTYQIDRALEAFESGGLWGKGAGNGSVKMVLPDAHADFVLAVAGEELGLIACCIIVMVFATLVVRGLVRVYHAPNLFRMVATTGLLVSFGLQALINMASNLRLMPAKGMTLPFISHGGSSLLALGITMGMVLALTRRRYD